MVSNDNLNSLPVGARIYVSHDGIGIALVFKKTRKSHSRYLDDIWALDTRKMYSEEEIASFFGGSTTVRLPTGEQLND